MKKYFKSLVVLLSIFSFSAMPMVASATDVFPACKTQSDTSVCQASSNNKILGKDGLLARVINLLLFVIGTISVILIIVGGIRYTTSGGDQAQISSAKNTILYAIVGLVIAVLSYAIVNFVVGSLL